LAETGLNPFNKGSPQAQAPADITALTFRNFLLSIVSSHSGWQQDSQDTLQSVTAR
jgi:hypothetical protein